MGYSGYLQNLVKISLFQSDNCYKGEFMHEIIVLTDRPASCVFINPKAQAK